MSISIDSGFNIRTVVEDYFKLLYTRILFVFSCKGSIENIVIKYIRNVISRNPDRLRQNFKNIIND